MKKTNESSKKVRLYPNVPVIGKSFKGAKRLTVPDQAMSLKEILRRFTRRESLPIEKDGYYEDRFIDLGKIDSMDITEKLEYAEALDKWIHELKTRVPKSKPEPPKPEPPKPEPPTT